MITLTVAGIKAARFKGEKGKIVFLSREDIIVQSWKKDYMRYISENKRRDRSTEFVSGIQVVPMGAITFTGLCTATETVEKRKRKKSRRDGKPITNSRPILCRPELLFVLIAEKTEIPRVLGQKYDFFRWSIIRWYDVYIIYVSKYRKNIRE